MRTIHDLPVPPGAWPLFGHAPGLDVTKLHRTLEEWATIHGAFQLRFGPRTAVVLADPAHVKSVLKDRPKTFRRDGHLAQIIEELQVRGVFTAEGARWQQERKLAMRAVGQQHLKGFFPLLKRVTEDLYDRWTLSASRPVDVLADCTCFTVDVTTELAFSEPAGALKGRQTRLLKALGPVFPAISRRLFAIVPYWRWVRLGTDRQLDAAVAEVRAYVGTILAEARTREVDTPRDFMEAMLQEVDGEGAFDDDALFGNAMTMLVAGSDTTSTTLAWTLHLLADHPEVAAELRAEVDAALGDERVPPTLESTRLPAMERVIHESMRLKPVGPLLFMQALEDTVLGDDLLIPAGTTVAVLSRLGAMDEACFPDRWRFDPSRWSDPSRASQLQRDGVFVPFGSGPRLCPGRALALLELRMALAMVVKNFDLVREGDSDDVREVNGFTMSPAGLSLRFVPRQTDQSAQG